MTFCRVLGYLQTFLPLCIGPCMYAWRLSLRHNRAEVFDSIAVVRHSGVKGRWPRLFTETPPCYCRLFKDREVLKLNQVLFMVKEWCIIRHCCIKSDMGCRRGMYFVEQIVAIS